MKKWVFTNACVENGDCETPSPAFILDHRQSTVTINFPDSSVPVTIVQAGALSSLSDLTSHFLEYNVNDPRLRKLSKFCEELIANLECGLVNYDNGHFKHPGRSYS